MAGDTMGNTGGAVSIDGREVASADLLERYRVHLVEREAAGATQEKYLRTVRQLLEFLEREGLELAKASLIAFKGELVERYAPATVNTMLAAVNGFARMLGRPELCVRRLRIQPVSARLPERELTEDEYKRLVRAALEAGDECMALAIQTICATGIRVSELRFVTAEAAREGCFTVRNKGKVRRVWMPEKLGARLRAYAARRRRQQGPVFVGRAGRPLDRTYIWRMMKRYARAAGIDEHKVFRHNLRHLFALAFYRANRDIDSLSHVLGHARLETTRIYLATDERERRQQVARLNLLL